MHFARPCACIEPRHPQDGKAVAGAGAGAGVAVAAAAGAGAGAGAGAASADAVRRAVQAVEAAERKEVRWWMGAAADVHAQIETIRSRSQPKNGKVAVGGREISIAPVLGAVDSMLRARVHAHMALTVW